MDVVILMLECTSKKLYFVVLCVIAKCFLFLCFGGTTFRNPLHFLFLLHSPFMQPKSQGSGNYNSQKHSSTRHQKSGSKRNPNGGPPFPVQLPYGQFPTPPIYHTFVPAPHMGIPGYVCHPCAGPFPSVETPLVKSGGETPGQPFIPAASGVNPSRSQPLPQGDPNARAVNFANRRPSMQQPGGPSQPWNHRAFGPGETIPMQQVVGPRTYFRAPFYGPAPGFMVGPGFPGNYTTMVS